jgi:hypothetical protein
MLDGVVAGAVTVVVTVVVGVDAAVDRGGGRRRPVDRHGKDDQRAQPHEAVHRAALEPVKGAYAILRFQPIGRADRQATW